MPDKFKNKYRTESARLQNWDYRSKAKYFVTICTKNRECFFGKIRNGEMLLNDVGKIVESEWVKTFELRPDMNLCMGEYIVMPNHFHGIIGIGDNRYNSISGSNRDGRDEMHRVSTVTTTTNGNNLRTKPPKNQFGPQSKNLGSIIRGFKSGVTVGARLINPDFGWQDRFHDHIIRDKKSFQRISEYIKNNPRNWSDDGFNDK
ncbi:transposase [Marivirga harenae]|uniref:transposase n=1 Tax=Marivirga harenae TaxID=2010992 RepID=UPI0026DEEE06|nr:transposase [Marivirga harenae]WKV13207.1 transposase [Marivirga harenae]|tara:strand:- start:140 stop:748 length:609 start_codon:yes stop_codon:yes gene_type:complete